MAPSLTRFVDSAAHLVFETTTPRAAAYVPGEAVLLAGAVYHVIACRLRWGATEVTVRLVSEAEREAWERCRAFETLCDTLKRKPS